MPELRERLEKVFQTVFPQLAPEDIPSATRETAGQWDSMGAVTLWAVLEEEFAISLLPGDFERLDSFEAILEHLRNKGQVAS